MGSVGMPKGCYSRDGELGGPWNSEKDAFVENACKTDMSYGAIAKAFARAFPHDPKSRSAIIARAKRQGWSIGKPMSHNNGVRNDRPRHKRVKVSKRKQKSLAPRVLRNDAEPMIGKAASMSRPKTAQQIEEARKGYLPNVVENKPLTSVPIDQCPRNGCKWPTNDDTRRFEVCGAPAEIGAYCERHAIVAYREMPTVKRNGSYARRGLLDAERLRIEQQDADWLAEHVMDDAPLIEAPPVAGLLEHHGDDADA